MAGARKAQGPVRVTQLVNCLGLGGTERQLVEHLRRLDPEAFEADVGCLQKVGELLPEVRALGIEPAELPLRGTLMRPNTAVQVARLARRMRAQGSQLLHCHDFYSNLLGSAAARLAGVPYIVSRRDLNVWIGPQRAAALRLVTSQATRVLCNAWAVRDFLVTRENVSPDRIVVVPNGLDLARFDAECARPLSAPLPASGSDELVVLVGNMKHAVKGHSELLYAARLVLQKRPQARFLLVGDGELRPGLEAEARGMGIAHAVLFAGRRTDVPAVLSRCRVAVCASHSEGLSNAIMEAMAARLPVVATAVGGNGELVREGRSGHLVPRGDPSDLARALLEVLANPQLARRMGEAGWRRVEDEFSAERLAARMGALYRELLGARAEVRRAIA